MESYQYFDRALMKARAKEVLKQSYWKAFFVTLVLAIFGAISGWSNNEMQNRVRLNLSNENIGYIGDSLTVILPIIMGFVATMALAGWLYNMFLAHPLEVGGCRYFLESTQYRFNFYEILFGFKNNYWNVVKTQFFRILYTTLWSLLFVIPGIIKGYAYSMVPYILAENPSIPPKRAITLSRHMTRGFRMSIFVMELSFIGWYLLGLLCFGVGVLFVPPYEQATRAEAYLFLRTRAIDMGMTSAFELTNGGSSF